MKDLGSKDKQTMLDMIMSRDLQKRCSKRGDGQARQAIVFCSIKNMREQDEIGFAKARISSVVIVIEEDDNDSLSNCVSHDRGQKWQYFREAMQKRVARVQHRLEA
ncbi:hypothetical protein GRJ2_002188800 [Grus japonensis]|uniref:Uncharacterized protein n=1 Tax=Grus japonensis TaxID=30415 RepID=A0ABC9XJL3_GRUJA